MANFLSRILGPLVAKATEGEVRPGPYLLPISGGWLSDDVGSNMNWWQMGFDVTGSGTRSAMVEACVSAYAQTVAMCPGDHWLLKEDGGRERVANSALTRVLKRPNSYQSISDFLLNAVRSLYLDGNAYALALRNDRYEISELHLMNPRQCMAQVAYNGEIFYGLGGNEIIERQLHYPVIVPQRDVLHLRLQSPRSPLRGESPLLSAAFDVAANDAMLMQQLRLYMNQARPSMVLSTDQVLTQEQVEALRQRWNEQSRGLNAGGTPILTAGLKVQPLAMRADESQLADMAKMTEQHIALAFRVPLQILGIGGSPFGSTEALMQSWIGGSLGFCLNHIEEAFGNLFRLRGQPDEYMELNTSALLRSLFKDRIAALAQAVQGSILAPNEARATEGYPEVKFGDEPRAQQQLVPLSAAQAIPTAPARLGGATPAAPPAPPAPPAPAAKEGSDVIDLETTRSRFRRRAYVLPNDTV